ncbi:CBM9 family sugar-binding protein [Flagellimonas allohymeniacidonis]|uniref:Sugar-binding protein n=1 Tax=Flagellimonas allohymeniacidonis TaxID=2517819 RepID=A0A4Q8QLE6_9FLAO|nr:CBM9 family sugar-binding protein [Allomuricauda hymeniacidonis]TAI49369.1 sugar-binding protein [Allomuricauda hymeniacidonis]
MRTSVYMALLLLVLSCKSAQKEDHQVIEVNKAPKSPLIDGTAMDACWGNSEWLALDQLWLGEAYSTSDFNGRYKLSWDEEALYLLVEVTDDVLFDQYDDPLKLWWDDDCVEVFIDEDNSGGQHQFSHNAFAYHIAMDGNVVDLAPDEQPRLYNDHITSKKVTEGNVSTWEIAIKLFSDDFVDGEKNSPEKLSNNKKVGFALAYCDNDGSKERENFIGSVFVPGEDKNQGWINADIFGTLVLK